MVQHKVDSLLTDTSIRRTPRVGPCLSLLSIRWTLSAGPKGVRLRQLTVHVITCSDYCFKMTKRIVIPGKSVTSKVLTSAWDS